MRKQMIAGLAAVLICSVGASAQTTILVNATLIDGTGSPPQPNVAITIERGRIVDIAPTPRGPSVIATMAGTQIVDLTGKFVVPGIINGHGHVGPAPRDAQLRQYALYGITTTTSMASDPDDVADFKVTQRAGHLRGSRLLTCKYRFTSMPDAQYRTIPEARAKVDENAKLGADIIKVWIDAQGGRHPKLTRDYVEAVLEQARKNNLITGAHVVELDDAKMVVDLGINVLLHNVRDREIDAELIAKMKARNVSVISTLAREEGMFVFGNGPSGPTFTDNPFFQKGLTPERLALLTKKHDEQANHPARARFLRMFDTDKKNLKKLADAGIRIGFGTDSGGDPNRFFVQGFFEHRQMELMRDAGLTSMQIIQAFSKNNSELLGIDKNFGTLAKGKAADLLVLAKNPLDDIANMRSIEAVYLGGRKFE